MFVATPMAQTASASSSDPLLLSNSFTVSSSKIPCKNILADSLLGVNSSLIPSQFERIDDTGLNKLVITAPKNTLTGSLMPVETVLKKATDGDLESDIIVTPSPQPKATITTNSSLPSGVTQVSLISNGSSLNAEVLFNLVNATRSQYGLPAFQKSEQICSVANSRAPEVDGEIWVTHNMHAGFYGRNLPFWATENLISMGSEQAALNWWLNSPVHRGAVLGGWKYACVACAGRSCSMIFSNLEAKYGVPSASQSTPTPVSSITPAITTIVTTPTK